MDNGYEMDEGWKMDGWLVGKWQRTQYGWKMEEGWRMDVCSIHD